MNKLALLSLFIIAVSASTHFNNKLNAHYGRPQHLAVGDKADILNFFKGFLKGVGEDQVFDSIKDCISDSKTIINNLVKGVQLIETRNAVKVQEGIALIGKACEAVPTAVQQCKAGGADVATLIKLIKTFKNPASFIYYIGKSLVINRVEVYGEVTHALEAYHQHDFVTFGYWVGKAMDTIFLGPNGVQSKEDVLAFTKGFLTGISTQSIFDNIKACVIDSKTFFNDVSTGIADIRSRDPARVKEGINLLGQAVQFIPTAAKDCKAAEADIKKLIKLAKEFTSPRSFIYHVGKSLLINHIEVIHEVTNAIEAYEHKDFYNLGYWVGRAMDTIFLALNQPLRQGIVDYVNKNQNGWKAELSSKFANMTLAQIKAQFLGAIPKYSEEEETIYDYETDSNAIPDHFNSAEQWPGCVHDIRDQGHCGSCWAFAASEVLSDRFCIASNKSVNLVFSPQYLVSCDNLVNKGCNGGIPAISWSFIVNTGLVTDSCYPYKSYNGSVPKCREFQKCEDGAERKFYHAKKGSVASLGNPKSIQENIMKFGPVEAAFSVYEDFISYKGGIYKHTSGSLLGGHAVKIVGWGRENGTDYWIVANSWNTTWGEKGFFRIAFGQVGIDKACLAGEADLSKKSSAKRFF